ncbi:MULTISPECIES: hypothetical protein [Fredinandcohnia]|uniref:Uncharacterized protein n=1 Tax=Fredinandcohnia salidurans TaxID=2595041 RepID=A0ABW4MMJ4_9BACI|nr:hypothetical protein [Fredinandcohnia onubensis]
MGKNGSFKNNDNQSQVERSNQDGLNQEPSNRENIFSVNAPGGVSIQVLGMDIKMSDLDITIGPDANISDIQSIFDQLSRRG